VDGTYFEAMRGEKGDERGEGERSMEKGRMRVGFAGRCAERAGECSESMYEVTE
jgi:hypothetical protein